MNNQYHINLTNSSGKDRCLSRFYLKLATAIQMLFSRVNEKGKKTRPPFSPATAERSGDGSPLSSTDFLFHEIFDSTFWM